jgi:predicted amidohydrolase
MMEKCIRAATVQFCHRADDKQYNLSVIENFIIQAHRENVQLLVFQKCALLGIGIYQISQLKL